MVLQDIGVFDVREDKDKKKSNGFTKESMSSRRIWKNEDGGKLRQHKVLVFINNLSIYYSLLLINYYYYLSLLLFIITNPLIYLLDSSAIQSTCYVFQFQFY